MRQVLVAVMAFGVLVLPATRARAEDDAATVARAHFRQGTKLYDLGHYLEAAKEYEAAYEAKDAPALLFNLGQAYRLGGDSQAAVRAYKSYLRRVPDAPNRIDVEARIAELNKAIAQQAKAKEGPPEGTIQPDQLRTQVPARSTPNTVQPTAAQLVQTAPPRSTPVYKKWWLWTAVGVVAAGVAVGVGVAVTTPNNAAHPADSYFVQFH